MGVVNYCPYWHKHCVWAYVWDLRGWSTLKQILIGQVEDAHLLGYTHFSRGKLAALY